MTVARAQTTLATYYVSPSGNDSHPCSQSQPCASFLRATSLTHPGDTVLVASGSYGSQQIHATGTALLPITVAASGAVTLTRPAPASDTLQKKPLLDIMNSSFVTISGFSIIGMKGRTDYIRAARPYAGEVEIEDHKLLPNGLPATGNGLVLTNLVVQHANNTCIKLEDLEWGVTIQNNTITDCGQPGNTGDHGMYITGPSNTMSGNKVDQSTGFGIQVFGGHVGSETITNNVVSHCQLAGILDYQHSATITGNVVFNNPTGMILGADQVIEQNIFANNLSFGIQFNYGGNDQILNNTFYQNSTEVDVINHTMTAPITMENNVFWGLASGDVTLGGGSVYPGDLFDYNDYYSIKPPPAGYGDTHSQAVDPKLVTPGTNFHLQTGSPAIAAGTLMKLVTGVTTNDQGALPHS